MRKENLIWKFCEQVPVFALGVGWNRQGGLILIIILLYRRLYIVNM